jgi:hypothetical protein
MVACSPMISEATHPDERGDKTVWISDNRSIIGIDAERDVITDQYTVNLSGGSLASARCPVDEAGNIYVPISQVDSYTGGDKVLVVSPSGEVIDTITVLAAPSRSVIVDGYLFTTSMAAYEGGNGFAITRLSDKNTTFKKGVPTPSSCALWCRFQDKLWFNCGGGNGDIPYFIVFDLLSGDWTEDSTYRSLLPIDGFSLFLDIGSSHLIGEYYNHRISLLDMEQGVLTKSVNTDLAYGTVPVDADHDKWTMSVDNIQQWGESNAAFTQNTSRDGNTRVYVFNPTTLDFVESLEIPTGQDHQLVLFGTEGNKAYFWWFSELYVYDIEKREVTVTYTIPK